MNIYEPRKQPTLDTASSKILFIYVNPERTENTCSLNYIEELSNDVITSYFRGQSLSINVKTRWNNQLRHCVKYEKIKEGI